MLPDITSGGPGSWREPQQPDKDHAQLLSDTDDVPETADYRSSDKNGPVSAESSKVTNTTTDRLPNSAGISHETGRPADFFGLARGSLTPYAWVCLACLSSFISRN